jgi:hypothetical protein
MKSKSLLVLLLTFALAFMALMAQLSFAGPSVSVGQNANSPKTGRMGGTMTTETPQEPTPVSPCRRRCAAQYRRCLRAADGNAGRRRACTIRYRNCLRQCR